MLRRLASVELLSRPHSPFCLSSPFVSPHRPLIFMRLAGAAMLCDFISASGIGGSLVPTTNAVRRTRGREGRGICSGAGGSFRRRMEGGVLWKRVVLREKLNSDVPLKVTRPNARGSSDQ